MALFTVMAFVEMWRHRFDDSGSEHFYMCANLVAVHAGGFFSLLAPCYRGTWGPLMGKSGQQERTSPA